MPATDIAAFILLSAAVLACLTLRDRGGPTALAAGAALALLLSLYAAWSLRWQVFAITAVSLAAVTVGLYLRRRSHSRRSGFLVGGLGIATLSAILPYYFYPIFDLPGPDGTFRVGVRSVDLRDTSRRGLLYTAPDAPRELSVTIWYPAPRSATGPARPYFTRREALVEGRSAASLWGFPAYRFAAFHGVGTHGIDDAPAAPGRFPIVIFSHGYWSYRAQNSALMERLASHGYIVVSIAHSRDAADVQLADGRVIPNAPHFGPGGFAVPERDAAFETATKAFMGADGHAKRIAAIPAYGRAVATHRLGQSLTTWRDDALFVARLLRETPPDSVAPIFARADFARTVYAGMSFGGSTAPSACAADPACVAAVDLDGENFDPAMFDRDVRAPLLLITTDQRFSEHQPADPAYNPTNYAWQRFECAGLRPDVVRLQARGIRHMGMTDLVLSARQPFLAEHFTSLHGRRALAMVNDTVLAFLDRHVRHAPAAAWSATLARYPESIPIDPRSLRAFAEVVLQRVPCKGTQKAR